MTLLANLERLARAATPGPWCYESIGEKGDGCNIVGVAFGPDDEDCTKPLTGRLPEWSFDGREIEYYRDEEVAVCEHRTHHCGANAAYIAALSPEVVLALIECVKAADAMRAGGFGFEFTAVGRTYDAARAHLEESCPT